MATSEASTWPDALEGFTKESFEADGKRRDLFRIGTGPAVIVIAEIPGITPQVAQFGGASPRPAAPPSCRTSSATLGARPPLLTPCAPSRPPASRGSSPGLP